MNLRPRTSTLSIATMAFLVMVSGGLQIAAVRPFFGERMHFSEGALHAYMSVNMLGAALGAPLAAIWADRRGLHRQATIVLAILDALLLGACTLPIGAGVVLALRVVQGATNVGVLSIILGGMGRGKGAAARSSTVGLAGGGIMFGVAFGPGIGGALLHLGPSAPIRVAAGLALVVALLAILTPAAMREDAPASSPSASYRTAVVRLIRVPQVLVPATLAFAERFTVGCFVVTFSLYAHRVRHLTDGQTALSYSLFLVPFALATYPFARAARAPSRRAMFLVGGALYGLVFLSFGFASGGLLAVALVLAGLASAMVYAPSLRALAEIGDRDRATAMALFHAAGCVGMLLGPAVAGMTTAALHRAGATDPTRYAIVFVIAGFAQLATLVALRRPLAALGGTPDVDSSAAPALAGGRGVR